MSLLGFKRAGGPDTDMIFLNVSSEDSMLSALKRIFRLTSGLKPSLNIRLKQSTSHKENMCSYGVCESGYVGFTPQWGSIMAIRWNSLGDRCTLLISESLFLSVWQMKGVYHSHLSPRLLLSTNTAHCHWSHEWEGVIPRPRSQVKKHMTTTLAWLHASAYVSTEASRHTRGNTDTHMQSILWDIKTILC